MTKAADVAYKKIRSEILDGRLAPGAQLKEEELAELCGVSRTPVREALRRLEIEMLVWRTETQRTYVTDWSISDIEEMFTLRSMLEGYAAARAAENITPEGIDRLKACNDALGVAVEGGAEPDVEAFLKYNRQFHSLLTEAAGSERLSLLLARVVEQPIVYRTALGYDKKHLLHSHREHAELISALAKGDSEWAKAIMVGHIRRAFYVYQENYMRQSGTIVAET
ncbi:MAG: GntR family transcriptional regulator [Alphaproteobacteria bacterium]|nr:MAG: GntR family transcriptional regulator [Alphaproteobacteria bacterium]